MKKRIPKPEKKSRKLFLPIFIALIMILSALGFMWKGPSKDQYKYNNLLFTKTKNGWLTYVDNKAFLLTYSPRELENITAAISLNNLNYAQIIFFSLNPEEDVYQAVYDFQTNMNNLFVPLLIPACTANVSKCINITLKNCQDATENAKVIIFKEENQTKITYKNNCLTIQGKGGNLTKATDKLILTLIEQIK